MVDVPMYHAEVSSVIGNPQPRQSSNRHTATAATGTFDLRSDVGRVTVSGHPGITVEREALGARGTGTIGQGGPTYKLQASAGAVKLQ